MQQNSTSPVKYDSLTRPNRLTVAWVVEVVTPPTTHSEMIHKRTFSYVMDIEQEEHLETPKKQKNESEGQLIKVTKTEGKKKQIKVKG